MDAHSEGFMEKINKDRRGGWINWPRINLKIIELININAGEGELIISFSVNHESYATHSMPSK